MRRLKFRPDLLTRIAHRNRQDIVESRLTRREMLKLGLLGASGYLLSQRGLSAWASGGTLESPPVRPFLEELPIPPRMVPVSTLRPYPQTDPLPGEGRTRPHQALRQLPPRTLYETHHTELQHSFHADLPSQTVWGFDGHFPGPTIVARYGEPILVRSFNDLPQTSRGFGVPQVSTHVHNGHHPSESDGFPCDFYPFQIGGAERFADHHYPNMYAGFTTPRFAPFGDPREALGTLFYHDHRVDFTTQNVYKGLVGAYLLFNDRDTGDETTGLHLPSGPYDVPMVFSDKLFDENGVLFFDLFGFDGLIGDRLIVNGKIQPRFQVHPRRYRLRWINSGPSRFLQLFLTDPNNPGATIPFTQISTDGNLLPNSLQVSSVRMSVSERADVIVDFSMFTPGSSILLENRLEQFDGRGPTGEILPAGAGEAFLRFDVTLPPVADDSQAPPYSLLPLPDRESPVAERVFRFDRTGGQWAMNGQFFDCDKPFLFPARDAPEIWTLVNNSGGWDHPIHIHFEEFQILSRNGAAPPESERGRKDTLWLGRNQEVRIYIRFRDFLGRYLIHCHNTVHEDHAMMARFDLR